MEDGAGAGSGVSSGFFRDFLGVFFFPKPGGSCPAEVGGTALPALPLGGPDPGAAAAGIAELGPAVSSSSFAKEEEMET